MLFELATLKDLSLVFVREYNAFAAFFINCFNLLYLKQDLKKYYYIIINIYLRHIKQKVYGFDIFNIGPFYILSLPSCNFKLVSGAVPK